MKQLDAESFASFISSGSKVVQFTADWCIDCKRVAPLLPELEERFADRFQFGQLDVDAFRSIAEEHQVKGIPTFIVFKDGEETGRLHSRDAKTGEQIATFLEQMAE